jgi:hypothetical protein
MSENLLCSFAPHLVDVFHLFYVLLGTAYGESVVWSTDGNAAGVFPLG